MRVKLGETNELKFHLSIKGSTSNPDSTQPTIRFLVTEAKSGLSMCFPMERLEEGLVKVTIPDMPHVFNETLNYTGKVEVIVGGRYFVPTQVGLVFERPTQVTASPVEEPVEANQASATMSEDVEDIFSSFAAATGSSGFASKVVFTETKKPEPAPTPKVVRPTPQDPAKAKLKSKLKNILSEAWNDD